MKRNKNNSLFDPVLLRRSLRASFTKLDPRQMIKNPIMFTVEAVTFAMLLLIVRIAVTGDTSQGSLLYNLVIFAVLLLTVLFANFAEAIAEARGRAQANSLRKTREETPAKRIEPDGQSHIVSSSELKQGDLFECVAGDTVAADGEIVEGLASIDESAITGESAPVIREAGGDKSSVTGGTKVLSDRILVKVTARPGESFLDRMIALVEGSSRQKTPNEIALTILLAGFTLVFVIVCATLKPFADYVGANITVAAFISLFVCLIPTTIGGLLSAIGIAGMDRALRANVITKSGKAVETAGDIDTLLLDKTGTITIGNRKATRFHPADGIAPKAFVRMCVLSSVADPTPEGKSVVELGAAEGVRTDPVAMVGVRMVKFTAETKCSGVDMPDGRRIRKGAAEAIFRIAAEHENPCPAGIAATVRTISENGGTPLVVCENERITGVIELQDIIKTGIRERFERLRRMGVKTVMVTGDNPLTAKYIAEKAGVDDFIAEARPEDKLEYIRREQQSGKLVAMMGDGTNDAPALAQADVGVAMNSGTQAAKEAGNMVDLDNDPTKLIEIVEIGKQLLMTRGTLTTFSIANDVAKYFAIVPALFIASIPSLGALNVMHLHSPESAILSAVIFNALIIPLLIPLALRGVTYKPIGALGPAAPQPLYLRTRWRDRPVRRHQTDRHVNKRILLKHCFNYEKPLDFTQNNAGDVYRARRGICPRAARRVGRRRPQRRRGRRGNARRTGRRRGERGAAVHRCPLFLEPSLGRGLQRRRFGRQQQGYDQPRAPRRGGTARAGLSRGASLPLACGGSRRDGHGQRLGPRPRHLAPRGAGAGAPRSRGPRAGHRYGTASGRLADPKTVAGAFRHGEGQCAAPERRFGRTERKLIANHENR